MKHNIKYLTCLTFIIPIPLVSILSSSCEVKIVWASYESYMDPDFINETNNDVDYLYYSNDDTILQKFKKTYDIACPSCCYFMKMLKADLLLQIDWTRYDLKYDDGNETIQNGHDVEEYLLADGTYSTDEYESLNVKGQIQQIDKYCWNDYEGDNLFPSYYVNTLINEYGDEAEEHCSILDFCIPYFIQTLVFIYRGEQINNLNNFLDVKKVITPNSPEFDNRFVTNDKKKFSIVDDMRSFFSMSSIIGQEGFVDGDSANYNMQPWNIDGNVSYNVNPINDDGSMNLSPNFSKSKYKKILSNLCDGFSSNSWYIMSDTIELSTSWSAANSNIIASIMYNGDAKLSLLGSGYYDDEENTIQHWLKIQSGEIPQDMQIINPENNADSIDFMVINKKDANNENKLNKIYKYTKKLLLDDVDFSNDENEIWKCDENDDYVSETMKNTDWNGYNSCWKKIDEYVSGTIGEDYIYDSVYTIMKEHGYDVDDDEDLVPEKWVKFLKKTYDINYDSYDFVNEFPLSDLDSSNLHWAFEESKSTL